ncbi:MAG: helix-turn-helix transcriptional regulator [Vulcanimicrobiota bacterium]
MSRCIVLHDDRVESINAGDFSRPGADFNCPYFCTYDCAFDIASSSVIFKEAPKILKPPCPYGKKSMIITFKADKLYIPRVKGFLSLKTTLNGNEIYEIDGKRYVVNNDEHLIINDGEAYSSWIDSNKQVESFCVFYGIDAVNQVFSAHSLPIEEALDEDYIYKADNIRFDKRINQGNEIISNILGKIRWQISNTDISDHQYIEEQILLLLKTIFISQKGLADNINDIMSIGRSQRIEILKRLLMGKEFIDSYFREKINISHVAKVSKLSKYQFIRLFKKVYGVTPGRYLTNRRLELARKLLTITDRNITDITMEIGFNDPSYFSRLFKKTYSVSPSNVPRNSAIEE